MNFLKNLNLSNLSKKQRHDYKFLALCITESVETLIIIGVGIDIQFSVKYIYSLSVVIWPFLAKEFWVWIDLCYLSYDHIRWYRFL